MASRYPIQNIPALLNRKIFFDANVLIYIFWPSGSYYWEGYYSTAFKNLLHQKNELFVDFIVISEVINRAIRLEHEHYLSANNIAKNNLPFKKYRDSTDGQSALTDIYLIVDTNILSGFTVIGRSFTKTEIRSLLVLDTLDFGDKGILLTCKENACVLLTNDVDYKTTDIDILTANPAILRI